MSATHEFRPGRFSGKCTVRLSRYPCPYPRESPIHVQPPTPDPDQFRCICDPTNVFDPADGPTPLAVEGCPAHRARRVYQQWCIEEGLVRRGE